MKNKYRNKHPKDLIRPRMYLRFTYDGMSNMVAQMNGSMYPYVEVTVVRRPTLSSARVERQTEVSLRSDKGTMNWSYPLGYVVNVGGTLRRVYCRYSPRTQAWYLMIRHHRRHYVLSHTPKHLKNTAVFADGKVYSKEGV